VLDLNRRCLPRWEAFFDQTPQDWENDIRYLRLGMVCQYLDLEVGIQYNQHRRDVSRILYTNPSDLFRHGVLDRPTTLTAPATFRGLGSSVTVRAPQ